mgnify:CR=1 FL=1
MITSLSINASGQEVKRIGILVAMEKEVDILKDIAKDDRVILMQSGIGKVNAAMACVEMIRKQQPDVVLSLGCAGGNGDGLHLGDVVVSTETAYHDVYCGKELCYGQVQGMPERYESQKWLVEKAYKVDNRVVPGLIVSGDWFVDSKHKMSEVLAHFPEAIAVDMESAAIAQVCYKYQIPFVALRIISDLPLSGEHASQYTGFWNTVSDKTFSVTLLYVESLLRNNQTISK